MNISKAVQDWFLEAVLQQLLEIKQKEIQIMAQIDDLNTAIQQEDVKVQDLLAVIAKVGADVDALLAKVAGGTTPTDLTAQLQAIQSHVASLTTGAQQLTDADKKANP